MSQLAVFFGVSLASVGVIVGYDVYMYLRHGTAGTISTAMANLPRLAVFACGVGVGAVVAGLAWHFWGDAR